MEFIENTGAEVQEVAEPAKIGVEEQEVAEPVEPETEPTEESGVKDERDAAFAAQRRAMEEAQRRAEEAERLLAEREAEENAKAEALRKITGREDAEAVAIAEMLGEDPENVMATLEAEREAAKKDIEIQRLREEVNSVKAEKEIQECLQEIQKIDPTIKDLKVLGDSFPDYIKAGLSPSDAYYAVKAKEADTRINPPKPPGKVNNEPPEKDYFTEAEVDAMTPEQQAANANKILESMEKWVS